MKEIKTLFGIILIVGMIATIPVTAFVSNPYNITSQDDTRLSHLNCLSIVGPNFCSLTEFLFLNNWETYGGNHDRTGPINPLEDRYGVEQSLDFLCDQAIITNYDLILLPGEFNNLNNSLSYFPTAISLIIDAYNEDLLFAGINHGQQILATADIISGKNISGPADIQSEIEAVGGNFLSEENGIQTDLPFITCTGNDEPDLIYAVALAFGIDLLATTSPYTPLLDIHLSGLIFVMGISLYILVVKKKRR